MRTWILEKSPDKSLEVNCTIHGSFQVTENVSTTCCLKYNTFVTTGDERTSEGANESYYHNETEQMYSNETRKIDQWNWLWGWSWLWLWTWDQVEEDSVQDKGIRYSNT